MSACRHCSPPPRDEMCVEVSLKTVEIHRS
jgi:hypothetical protein